MEREQLSYDVVIVGAGPSGLSAACRLKQLAQSHGHDLSVCVVEKGAEVGAHLLSGAILQPTALNELFPDWQNQGAPLTVPVTEDDTYYLTSAKHRLRFPKVLSQRVIHNEGNYVISLGVFCRWLAQQAEALGVEIYSGFTATEPLYNEQGAVVGIQTGDMGVDEQGQPKANYQPGIHLMAKYTMLAEGCRGHIGKQIIQRFKLSQHSGTQHYALGIKEVWQVPKEKHQPGKVVHCFGWPLSRSGTTGGAFVYHYDHQQVVLGLITDLNYSNPHVSPFDELQQWKTHELIKPMLEGGERIAYGARALAKGGLQAIPQLAFPGGVLIGCDAGFMNYPKIKGNHTAMKSGMLAAESVFDALLGGSMGIDTLHDYPQRLRQSWLYKELHQSRNVAPGMHRFGMLLGSVLSFLDYGLLRGRLPYTLQDQQPDHETLKPVQSCKTIEYPKPDGKLTFDKLSSVFLSHTNHAEHQPCHLKLADSTIPLTHNLVRYNEPAQRYCPAGVYEVVQEHGATVFRINSQNCVHCKTCDIKDPLQNITWVPPEAGGGPNYGAM